MFESAFEVGNITWPAFTGVDERVRGVLADEIGVCAYGTILSQRRKVR